MMKMSQSTKHVLVAVSVLGVAYYLWSQRGKNLWSNASGGGFATASRQQKCAVYANPDGTYSNTGAGQSPQSGAVCVTRYA